MQSTYYTHVQSTITWYTSRVQVPSSTTVCFYRITIPQSMKCSPIMLCGEANIIHCLLQAGKMNILRRLQYALAKMQFGPETCMLVHLSLQCAYLVSYSYVFMCPLQIKRPSDIVLTQHRKLWYGWNRFACDFRPFLLQWCEIAYCTLPKNVSRSMK